MIYPIALLLTDTHLTGDNIEDNKSIFKQAIDFCKALEIKRIIHGGDIFTSRAALSMEVLLAFDEILFMLEEEGMQLDAIPGNHDKTNLDSLRSYLSVFRKHDLLNIHSDQDCVKIDKVDFWFLPYFNELYPERLKKINEYCDRQQLVPKRVLITHVAVNGVKNNDGSVVSSNITPDLFKEFDNVFIGHYHNRSLIGKNINYVGSAMPHNFGEDNEKGFVVIYNDASFEYVTPEFKKYIKIKVKPEELTDKRIKQLIKEQDTTNNYVRVVLTGTNVDIKTLDISTLLSNGFDVKKEAEDAAFSINATDNEEVVKKFTKSDLLKSFLEFCKINEIQKEQKSFGLKYIKQI